MEEDFSFPQNTTDLANNFFAHVCPKEDSFGHHVLCKNIENSHNLLALKDWFKIHIKSEWRYHFSQEGLHMYFKDPHDAMRFKITH